MELPVTIADWAATEARFKQHFKEVPAEQWDDSMVPFHEFVAMTPGGTRGQDGLHLRPRAKERKLRRLRVSIGDRSSRRGAAAILVAAAAAGRGSKLRRPSQDMVATMLEDEIELRSTALRAEYEAKMAESQGRATRRSRPETGRRAC